MLLITYVSSAEITSEWPWWKELHTLWRNLPNYNPLYVANGSPGVDHSGDAEQLFSTGDESWNVGGDNGGDDGGDGVDGSGSGNGEDEDEDEEAAHDEVPEEPSEPEGNHSEEDTESVSN